MCTDETVSYRILTLDRPHAHRQTHTLFLYPTRRGERRRCVWRDLQCTAAMENAPHIQTRSRARSVNYVTFPVFALVKHGAAADKSSTPLNYS